MMVITLDDVPLLPLVPLMFFNGAQLCMLGCLDMMHLRL